MRREGDGFFAKKNSLTDLIIFYFRQTNKIFARKSRLLKKQKKVQLEERITLLTIENKHLKQILFEQDVLLKELNIVFIDDMSASEQTCSSCSSPKDRLSSESSDFESDYCVQSDGEDGQKPIHFDDLDLDLAEFMGFDF